MQCAETAERIIRLLFLYSALTQSNISANKLRLAEWIAATAAVNKWRAFCAKDD